MFPHYFMVMDWLNFLGFWEFNFFSINLEPFYIMGWKQFGFFDPNFDFKLFSPLSWCYSGLETICFYWRKIVIIFFSHWTEKSWEKIFDLSERKVFPYIFLDFRKYDYTQLKFINISNKLYSSLFKFNNYLA